MKMEYLEPKIVLIVFTTSDILTDSQEHVDIWGPDSTANNGEFNQ
jgi:hypothetical protein